VTRLPEPIGDEVRRELGRFPESGLGEIVAAWPAAVGAAIAANAWPARVARDGTLHVSVSSSAWAFELTQLSASVLERLREQLGETCPPTIRFAVGPLPEGGGEAEQVREGTVPAVTPAHVAEAERVAAEISDPALREAVVRAVAAGLAAQECPADDRPVW
jgi:hypothetical protein